MKKKGVPYGLLAFAIPVSYTHLKSMQEAGAFRTPGRNAAQHPGSSVEKDAPQISDSMAAHAPVHPAALAVVLLGTPVRRFSFLWWAIP